MAKADDSYKDLQEEVTCPICMELYEDPRILPCSHTLCFKCIEGVIRAKGDFKCPFRCNVQVSQQDIGQLPLNRVIHNIVDRMKTNKPANPNARASAPKFKISPQPKAISEMACHHLCRSWFLREEIRISEYCYVIKLYKIPDIPESISKYSMGKFEDLADIVEQIISADAHLKSALQHEDPQFFKYYKMSTYEILCISDKL
ncbi:unnamed protein product [Adineta ricciae]|uniref:RING-type domain-containing protein n=1 Tax=Adineta ricciae TaxID=249248 RepID=A0A813QYU3_ADIRI|nr:unnamed protein product [Adineta ricciae]CAF1026314.1 unnamed protein product [Adineta ricciae]